MGKWTPGHFDTVLAEKMKSLVCGAIDRHKQETIDDAVPPSKFLNYETFVQSLEQDDCLAKSLIETLVTEIADRASREQPTDPDTISMGTYTILQSIPSKFYTRGVPMSRPRSHRASWMSREWADIPAFQGSLASDDDIMFGLYPVLDPPQDDPIDESAADMHNPLYDAFYSNPADPTNPREPSDPREPLSSGRQRTPIPDLDVEAYRSGIRSHRFISPPRSLVRQPSILRGSRTAHHVQTHARTRAADFTEFSTRRRSNFRSLTAEEMAAAEPRASPGSTRSSGTPDPSIPSIVSAYGSNPQSPSLRRGYSFDPVRDALDTSSRETSSQNPEPSSSALTRSESADTVRAPSSGETLRRLRRGGVRPPELVSPPRTIALSSTSPTTSTDSGSPPLWNFDQSGAGGSWIASTSSRDQPSQQISQLATPESSSPESI